MMRPTSAEEIISAFCITEPEEIDVEAIAEFCGAQVRVQHLVGCEASIIGRGGRAIITVNASSSAERQRFSVAHELRHWLKDRGTLGMGCTKEQLGGLTQKSPAERLANDFASALLMPTQIFAPRFVGKPLNFETVNALARTFRTSTTATALRVVKLTAEPAILLCCADGTLKWHWASSSVPHWLKPTIAPGRGTAAFAMLKGSAETDMKRSVAGDEWLEAKNAGHCTLREHSVRRGGRVLCLLSWKDPREFQAMVGTGR